MFSLNDIKKNYADGLISIIKHPFADLYILNYTSLASKKAIWNNVTLNSRGLIIDKRGTIISLPFRKFFEIKQLSDSLIPKNSPMKVYEKLDGTLGIMYWHNGKPYISTRGSFTSYQAIMANNILHERYSNHFHLLINTYTYLFEIIIPTNRIVVDYQGVHDLFLIGVFDNITLEEIDIESLKSNPFPLPNSFWVDKYTDLISGNYLNKINTEGYVGVFENKLRIKIKNDNYKKLYEFYRYTIKKYTLDKHINNKFDNQFESKLAVSDLKWINLLTLEIEKLREHECDYNTIFRRILTNQFFISIDSWQKCFNNVSD